jgi:phosphate transport system protein
MTDHTMKSYEDELALLDTRIASMGALTASMLAQAFQALESHDAQLAGTVVTLDRRIDQQQRDLEEQAVVMIARRQPMADDLRHIVGVMRIVGDLERIGDLAKNTAKRALAIAGQPHPRALISGLRLMLDLALRQLKSVLEAYATRDAERALEVWRGDEKLDAMYNSILRELLTYMMEDPRNIGLSTHLLFGAKNLERVGDHSTNIAETVVYLVRGEVVSLDRPKGDATGP